MRGDLLQQPQFTKTTVTGGSPPGWGGRPGWGGFFGSLVGRPHLGSGQLGRLPPLAVIDGSVVVLASTVVQTTAAGSMRGKDTLLYKPCLATFPLTTHVVSSGRAWSAVSAAVVGHSSIKKERSCDAQ